MAYAIWHVSVDDRTNPNRVSHLEEPMKSHRPVALVVACAFCVGIANAQHAAPDHSSALAAVESHLSSGTQADEARVLFGLQGGRMSITVEKRVAALPFERFAGEIKASTSCALRTMEGRALSDSLRAYSYVQRIQPTKRLDNSPAGAKNGDLVIFFSRPVGNMMMAAVFAAGSDATTYEEYAASWPGLHFLFCADSGGRVVETFAKRNGNVQ